jgi:hypothetical protein
MSAPPSLSAAASSRKFVGHLYRLTPQQEAALGEFKNILEKDGLYKPQLGGPGEKGKGPSHDDATLL